MAASKDLIVSIKVDASQAIAEIDRLREHLDAVPDFEVTELEELTWHWPYWILFLTSVGGGLTVLLAFFLIGSVFT